MKTSHKLILLIATVLTVAYLLIFNPTPFNNWIAACLSVFLILVYLFLYSLCRLSGEASEREERLHLAAWRKGLQRGDLVNVRGMVHRIEALHPKVVVELFRYSEENSFATLGECWPVE